VDSVRGEVRTDSRQEANEGGIRRRHTQRGSGGSGAEHMSMRTDAEQNLADLHRCPYSSIAEDQEDSLSVAAERVGTTTPT
jgi:hypothetical protein